MNYEETKPKIVVNSVEDNNSNKKKTGNEQDFRIKYKTEMCRNWELGKCPFDDKCAFAHGHSELRMKTHISMNYKTKRCRQFYQLGYCRYGQRCQFIHMEGDISRSNSPSPNRLPVFINIERQGDN